MLAGSQRSHRLHKPQRFKALMPVKLMVYKVRGVQGTEEINKQTQLRTQALLKDKGLVWCDDGRPGGGREPWPSMPTSSHQHRRRAAPSVARVHTARVRPLVHRGILFWALWKFLFYETQGRI